MPLYAGCSPETIDNVRFQLSTCVADVAQWCKSRRLRMNSDKFEVMWFGARATLARLAAHDCSLQIGSETIAPATTARLFGVLLDAELTTEPHIARTATTCFYPLRRICQIRRSVGADIVDRLVLALVTSRLDYCNSSLAGLPRSTLDPLQRVQNAAARLMFELRPRDHVTPSLIQLHWPCSIQVVHAYALYPHWSRSGLFNEQCAGDVHKFDTLRSAICFLNELRHSETAHKVR